MGNYIMLDDQKFEMNDSLVELLRGIVRDKEKDSPFAREEDQTYHYINDFGNVSFTPDNGLRADSIRYEIGNYCTDEKLMKQRALHETLSRLLWRYSMENGEGENTWDCNNAHYEIYWTYSRKSFDICCNTTVKSPGSVYFPTKELANQAIDEIIIPFIEKHPEFV